jgi:hypothetical protein
MAALLQLDFCFTIVGYKLIMILFFRLLSNDADDFIMEVAINATSSFMDLHLFIQKSLDFDPSNMASFIITDTNWNREHEVSLMRMSDEDEEVLLMDDTTLSEFVKGEKQRLMYVFDFFSERAFFMEVFNVSKEEIETHKLIKIEGSTPQQIEVGDMITADDYFSANELEEEDSDGEFLDYDNLDLDNLPDDSY